ncbi:TetR family transcriptional regulator C-terminal domain-containing protein [Sanguibacter sp. 25GB23B1]|uniref:TetR/AcrR family transcriptional regulator n=1 Tax=unclassified Sanguibacter TaxID=2645534 RepID=UPI0032AF62EF
MPKLIDHSAREVEVAEAAWRVLVRDGPTRLSVRNVAAEAGLATGSLRRSFPTQDALRVFALELVSRRVRRRLEALTEQDTVRATVRTYLEQILPLDDDRRVEMEVFLAIGTLALTDPGLRPAYDDAHAGLAHLCESTLRALVGSGEGYAAPDLAMEARRTHALVDGLALHLVRQPPGGSTSWARDVLDAHLDSLRTG